jgi:hypothetical protein
VTFLTLLPNVVRFRVQIMIKCSSFELKVLTGIKLCNFFLSGHQFFFLRITKDFFAINIFSRFYLARNILLPFVQS